METRNRIRTEWTDIYVNLESWEDGNGWYFLLVNDATGADQSFEQMPTPNEIEAFANKLGPEAMRLNRFPGLWAY